MAIKEQAADTSDSTVTDTTVLFVDDESTLIEMYEALFAPEFSVLTAESGTEALDVFDAQVDIAFVDRRMPDIDGEEVVESLRAEGYDTPVVFVSAVDPGSEPAADHAAYLTKPIDSDTIRTAIRQHAG